MSLPYFPMFPADFDADTGHLTLAEDGAYNRLLRLQWRAPGCKLPADMEWIFRKAKAVSEADRAVIMSIIAEFFTTKGGKIFSARLLKEWVKSDVAHSKRVLAGKKGGDAKALKSKENTPSNAKAMLKQPEPEPEPKEEKKETIVSLEKTPRRKPELPLPEGWVPSDRNIADAKARNFTSQEIDRHAEQFRNYHTAKGNRFRDWDAAWRTWLGNADQFRSPGSRNAGTSGGHSTLFAGFQRAASGLN